MFKIVKSIKNTVPAFVVVAVALGSLLPAVVPYASAADFNQGSQPYATLRVSNFTQNPGSASHWFDNSVDAEVDDIVSFGVFVHNTSSETANDTRVSISYDINSGGSSIDFTAKISADNASVVTDTVTVDITDGDAQDIDHVSTTVYDNKGNIKSFFNSESSVMTSGGLDIGDIAPGRDNARIVVARVRINGQSGGSDNLNVDTVSADSIQDDRARLRCDVDTADADAQVWFEWGEDDNDLDEETSDVNVDSNESNKRVTKTISNLDEDTKYYFRCLAEDDDGDDDKGQIRSFRTDKNGGGSGDEPSVTTLAATGIDSTSATLRCEVDPNGDDTDAWFEWGISSTNLNRDTSKEDVGDGNSDVDHSERITGLVTNTNYFYRCLAKNSEGEDRGSVRSFRTISPTIITRFIDVFREVEVAPKPDLEALIITLEADARSANSREIFYTVSYDNRTDLTLTNVELLVEIPRELDFVDANPTEDELRGDDPFFNIGTVRPREKDSFLIETELSNSVDENDLIVLVAHVEYNDDGSARKVVKVINESTYGELVGRTGNFTANVLSALRNFFTSPILWLMLFIALIIFVIRYLFAARKRRDTALV